jgi:Family of unknown function (DUF6132)
MATTELGQEDIATSVEADNAPKRKRTMILHTVVYVVGGAALGFGYYKLVGCRSGSCPITSNPYVSMLYGAVMGFLAGGGMGK